MGLKTGVGAKSRWSDLSGKFLQWRRQGELWVGCSGECEYRKCRNGPPGRRVGVRIRAGDLVGSERKGKLWEGSADGEK